MPPPYNYEGENDMMGFSSGGLGFILVLVFCVAVIVLAMWLLSGLFPQATGASPPPPYITKDDDSTESPLDILKRRYARGEISKAEYEEMRHDLVG
jgi:putative membrane protein